MAHCCSSTCSSLPTCLFGHFQHSQTRPGQETTLHGRRWSQQASFTYNHHTNTYCRLDFLSTDWLLLLLLGSSASISLCRTLLLYNSVLQCVHFCDSCDTVWHSLTLAPICSKATDHSASRTRYSLESNWIEFHSQHLYISSFSLCVICRHQQYMIVCQQCVSSSILPTDRRLQSYSI